MNPDNRCIKCGLDKADCKCKNTVYYFEGCISVFYNKGSARNALYKYKLTHRDYYVSFFIPYLVKALNTEYKDIKFDAVFAVPSSVRNRIRRGFNQAALLAKGVSKMSGIPYISDLLYCKAVTSKQHKASFEERRNNVRKRYYISRKMSFKNVLLIDDIRTTGFTLDACARQLLLSGADKVYCLTVLGNIPKDKTKH